MNLKQEQLQFFFDEVLGELDWGDEVEATGIDPLKYVRQEINVLRQQVKRLRKSLELRDAAEQMRAADAADWHCKNCNVVNFGFRENCRACGAARR